MTAASPMDPQKVSELRSFIQLVENKPEVVHLPPLAFFKDFLIRWGCDVQKHAPQPAAQPKEQAPAPEPTKVEEEPPVVEEEEVEPQSPDLDLFKDIDDPDRLDPEDLPLPDMGRDMVEELTDEEMDKVGQLKQTAQEMIEDGDIKGALEKYTEVIKIACPSALLYTRRAELLLKLRRPLAAVRDCDEALKLNPDSGKAYRVRGVAHRKLQKWKEAHSDLAMGQKIDYDEGTVEVQRFVDEKYKKIAEVQRAYELKLEDFNKKKREKEIKRRRAAAEKARKEQEARAPEPDMPGMDADFMSYLNDPEVMGALSEIMQDQSKITKYLNNPKIMKAMAAMQGMMGGMGKGKGKGNSTCGSAGCSADHCAPSSKFNDDGGDP